MAIDLDPSSFIFRPIQPSDIARIFELESDGFPSDEAASLETIQYRHSVVPDLFIGAYDQDQRLHGFINATRANSDSLDHHSLTHHDPNGKNILIHSVCVDRHHRRRKLATRMLRQYITLCSQAGNVSNILLVCHKELKSLYLGVGFVDRGPSTLEHGPREWFEMGLELSPQTNPTNLFCPQERCRSIILKKGVGRLIERETCPLPVDAVKRSTSCWLVPSPISFENIGFSKPIVGSSSSNALPAETRWLSCGACDFGPLGWTESSINLAQEFSNNPKSNRLSEILFLLACDRVVNN
ncbi:hypothetical protein O181_071327 [Austropuccinia psidii MF-1]|uniref:N-acetyltransferase domain-containing protein n=1 Tax=Austropuccinia psidii MF-1 TaxID=1389203 RepID=A0A9Q3I930_9BASI|nr:hypothetical protein [Austropuccinia psidii MF-1]